MKVKRRLIVFLMSLALIGTMTACRSSRTSSENESVSDSELNGTTSSDFEEAVNATSDGAGTDGASTNTSSKGSTSAFIDMASLKGKTVNVLLWREETSEESKRITKFTNETGIKVSVNSVDSSTYTAKLSSMVAAGDSPDLASIQCGYGDSQGAFPLGAASLFQPLSVTNQDLSDSAIWDLYSMDQMKLKGKYYAFIANNAWYNCGSIIMYNEDLLNTCGAQKPYDLWKNGNWNWDTMKQVALKVYEYGQSSGNSFSGMGMIYSNSALMGNYLASSCGTDFVSYNGTKYADNTSEGKLINAWTYYADLRQSKAYNSNADANSFFSGSVALYPTNIWAMKIDGGQIEHCKFTVNAVPFPSPAGSESILPGNPNAFGIPKGAKEAVAAGVFLKYFVDPANGLDYVMLTGNEASRETFNYLSNPSTKKNVAYAGGAIGYTNLASLQKLRNALTSATSNQVTTVLQQYKSLVSNSVDKINKVIAK